MLSRQLRMNLSLTFLATIVALFSAEFLLRASGLGATNPYLIHKSVLVHKPFHSYLNRLEANNVVRFNNFGFHDVARSKHTDAYRILVLGDSFVEGDQVPTDTLFTRVLESKLAASAFGRIEIMNCGVSGTQTAFEYKLWQDYLQGTLGLGYDHVLLVVFLGNDLIDNVATSSEAGATPAGWFLSDQAKLSGGMPDFGVLKSAVARVRDYSTLVNTVYTSLYRLKRIWSDRRRDQSRVRVGQIEREALEVSRLVSASRVTADFIEAWAKELHRAGKTFDVALIPGYEESNKEPIYREFCGYLRELGTRAGFGVVYLEIDQAPSEYCFLEGRGHLNARGHSFVADALYGWLTRRYARVWPNNSGR